MSEKFHISESGKVSLKGNLHDFSVYYNAIDKSDILNIHKYQWLRIIRKIIIRRIIRKIMFGFIKKMLIGL